MLGFRHALEPDHLAAVTTIAAEQRSAGAGLRVGALWGLGHSLALLLVAGSLAATEQRMPESWALALEVVAAVVVVGLGLRAIRRAVIEVPREGEDMALAQPFHAHGGLVHRHSVGLLAPPRVDTRDLPVAVVKHVHFRRWILASRPLFVGVLHGLAGSGALTALVLVEMPTQAARLGYISLFGLGSVAGMALLSGVVGIPLKGLARAPRLASGLLLLTGLLSTAVGSVWGYQSSARLLGM
jgi:hypothetical protein